MPLNCRCFLSKMEKLWICVSITRIHTRTQTCKPPSRTGQRVLDYIPSIGAEGWPGRSLLVQSQELGRRERPLWASITFCMRMYICVWAQVCACECMVVVKPPPSYVLGLVWIRIPQTFGNSQRSWGREQAGCGGLQSLASPCDSPALGWPCLLIHTHLLHFHLTSALHYR